LASSIIDGRWKEQKSRLQVYRAKCRDDPQPLVQGCVIGYLIEGDFYDTSRKHSVPPSTLVAAASMSSARDGFTVLQSASVSASADILKVLLKKSPFRGYSELRERSLISDNASGLDPPMLSKQQKYSEKNVVFLRMLMCIPGVSLKIAKHVKQKYPNVCKLQRALREKSIQKQLADSKPAGAKRKLGKNVVQKLVDGLIDNRL